VRIADRGTTNLQATGQKVGNVQPQRLSWPIRSGTVPPLADCYSPRAESGPALTSALYPGGTVVLCDAAEPYRQPGPVAAVGQGGTGKTQIAAGFAHTLWEARAVDLLVWISATSREAVLTGYAVALADVGGAGPGQDAEAAARQFLAWLAGTSRAWLVVLDDLIDPVGLDGLWPQGQAGRVLVTTRMTEAALSRQKNRIAQVGVFTRREALNFLTARLSEDPDQRIGALDVAEDLSYLPLALAHAAATIAGRRMDCRQYRTRFADMKQRLAGGAATEHGLTIAATWSLATDCADQLAPAGLAWPALALAALLDPNGIPAPVLVSQAACAYIAGRGATGTPAGETHIRMALYNLAHLGVVTIDPGSAARTVRVHALVQASALLYLPPRVLEHAGWAAASALVQAWPDDEAEPHLAQAFRDCTASLRGSTRSLLWTPKIHPVLLRAGQSLGSARLTGPAIAYWQALIDTSSRLTGGGTLRALGHLAGAYENAGRLTDAIALFERALEDHERVQGKGHADTARSRASLAAAYDAAGRPADAIGVHVRCVADLERTQGTDHPDTFAARESLGHAYRAAGRMKEAIPIFERALADRERTQGPDHPGTLTARGNLAYAYRLAGRTKQAILLYRRTLADRERVQGHGHLDTLTARGNLAHAYHTAGRMADAIAVFRRTLADCERVLGPGHPMTRAMRENLETASRT
jgi:tetratricopeptide (TPR) repeat protein